MNSYCNPLNISIQPLKSDIDIRSYRRPQEILPLEVINPEIKDLFLNLGIKITFIEVFYRPPGNIGSIHIDSKGGDYSKINWIYDGKNSVMEWFRIKPGVADQTTSIETSAGTSYISYDESEVELVHREFITGPALVQVGVLHRVINPEQDRWCLCFVLCSMENRRLKICTATEILKDYISI